MEKYYKEVKKALVCMPKAKIQILKQLRCSVEDYIDSHPDCTRNDIESHFGSPRSIAEQYATLNGIDYKKYLKINKMIKILILIVLALLLIYAIAACIGIAISIIENPVYYYEIILED